MSKIPMRVATLADRFETREEPAQTALQAPSDWGATAFKDLNFKVSEPIRAKHWQEAAMRGWSNKKLYLAAMQAFYKEHGSLIERAAPELIGIEALEFERGR